MESAEATTPHAGGCRMLPPSAGGAGGRSAPCTLATGAKRGRPCRRPERSEGAPVGRSRFVLADDLLPLLQVQDRTQRPAALDLLAQAVLALAHLDAAVRDLLRLLPGHDDDAHVVGDDPVAAAHQLAAAAHLAADLAVALGLAGVRDEIGRASWRERVEMGVGGDMLKTEVNSRQRR